MTDAILDRLMRLHPKLIDLELGRIERLLADVGSPHLKLPPVVHVAGTNGKGSLVAYLRAMAEAAGYRVHVYTSPHLVRFNERIRVAGELIDDELLEDVLTEAEQANREQPITFFEITTVAAFLAFARVPGRPRRARGRDGRAHATPPTWSIPRSRPSRRSATTTRASSATRWRRSPPRRPAS